MFAGKLREGLRSIRRIDEFAAEGRSSHLVPYSRADNSDDTAYETSARYAIHAANYQQLGSCLPHLIFDIYPVLYPPPPTLEESLYTLSVTSSVAPPPIEPPLVMTKAVESRINYYKQIYLIYLLVYLDDVTSFKAIATSLKTTAIGEELAEDPFELVNGLYQSIRSMNYIAFQRIFAPPQTPFPLYLSSSSKTQIDRNELVIKLARLAIPKMRASTLAILTKSYKTLTDLQWLQGVLLLESQEETEMFLKANGIGI